MFYAEIIMIVKLNYGGNNMAKQEYRIENISVFSNVLVCTAFWLQRIFTDKIVK